MKRISKLFFVIAIISMLLFASCSYATDALVENTTADDMIIDSTLDELYTANPDDGIMLINDEIPINEESGFDYIEYADSDVYLINNNISFNKNVTGNVYIMGQNVEITSSWINGNVFVMGNKVTIKGSISGSIYVMGQTVDIETEGVGTVYALAQELNLGNSTNIANDLKASAETINIDGNVYREIYIAGKDINVSNTAGYVGKGKVYYSDSITDENGILGNIEIVKTEDSKKIEDTVKTAIVGATIRTKIINTISAALVIVVIYFMVRNRFIENEEASANAIAKTVLSGFAWLVCTPFVFILLLCTVIGIPLALMLLVLYCIALYITVPVASLKIGSLISNNLKQENKLLIMVYAICAYIVIELISIIPILGGLVKFLVVLYGLGIFMKVIFSSKDIKQENKEEVVEVIKTDVE